MAILILIITAPINAAVILQYHHVDDNTPSSTSITITRFKQHLRYLQQNNFSVWPLPELISQLKQGNALPERSVAITFDDGYISIYKNALPLLKQFNYPFTVFINTELVGSYPFMNWQHLKNLQNFSGTIANHAASHEHLIRFRANESIAEYKKRIRLNLEKAEQTITRKLGRSPRLLAYPYGEYNNLIKQIAKQLKLTAFSQLSGAFNHQQVDWQAIPRFAFGGDYTRLESFIDKVNSLPMPLEQVEVVDEHGNKITEPLIPIESRRPVLKLTLKNAAVASRIQCFATGQERIEKQQTGTSITVTTKHDIPVGRSRYNCTAASGQSGRYYWYSQFFIRRQPDGNWYSEE